ncbi:hypothetical protein [Salinactinospora qingdaonensis]|uniref:Uncharacterized protein n=1 Tax=Salinactinospora qingdaonensis TaxID=702744 RepID=A0ABP7F5H0_9ACTN
MNARPVSTDLVLAIRDVLDRHGYRSAGVRSLGAAAAVVARLVEVHEGQTEPGEEAPPRLLDAAALAAPGAVRVTTSRYADDAPSEVQLHLGPVRVVLEGTGGAEVAVRIAAAGAVASDILTPPGPTTGPLTGGAPAATKGGHR